MSLFLHFLPGYIIYPHWKFIMDQYPINNSWGIYADQKNKGACWTYAQSNCPAFGGCLFAINTINECLSIGADTKCFPAWIVYPQNFSPFLKFTRQPYLVTKMVGRRKKKIKLNRKEKLLKEAMTVNKSLYFRANLWVPLYAGETKRRRHCFQTGPHLIKGGVSLIPVPLPAASDLFEPLSNYVSQDYWLYAAKHYLPDAPAKTLLDDASSSHSGAKRQPIWTFMLSKENAACPLGPDSSPLR